MVHEEFIELLRESVLVQSLITLLVVSIVCYLVIVQQPVPELLSQVMMLVIGFYFGSKTQQQFTKGMKYNASSNDNCAD